MQKNVRANFIEDWCVFLRRIAIFAELEEDAIKQVAHKLQPLSLPRGAVIYHEGEVGNALYIVESGRVKVTTRDDEGQEKVLNYLGRGEIFGETTLLTGIPRSVTVMVDSTANFLVLYRNDFETFLKKNPTASLYLSRVISQRLMVAHKTSMVPAQNPEIMGILSALERDDRLIFLLNLSLSLLEQTRRRILLVTFGPDGARAVESLRLKPVLSSPSMLQAQDLSNPRTLERMALQHPSGLELLTLPEDVLHGSLSRSIPHFLDALSEAYDFALVDLSGLRNLPEGLKEDRTVRDVISGCDRFYHVRPGGAAAPDYLQPENFEGKKIQTVVLAGGPAEGRGADFTVPWNGLISETLRRGSDPVLGFSGSEPALRALGRIARCIGKLQVGLAMGSGAAYGYTLIGMLKVLEREKIPIDFISGTSMGALLGSFYASGMDASALESVALSITKVWLRRNILRDLNLPWPHGGLLLGQTISKFLRNHLGDVDFKDLPIPFACAATDIMTGEGVVLREGRVWEAVRASLSLPMIFCPFKVGNRFLVDGGLVNPVPTSVIASMGADILIAVNLTTKASERRVSLRRLGMFPAASPGMANIFFKMIYTMQYQISSAKHDISHIMIRPEMRNFSWIDLHRAKQIIPLGEEAAEDFLPKIKARLPYFSDFCPVPQRARRSVSL